MVSLVERPDHCDPDITFHRTHKLPDHDIVLVDGIPVTSLGRTVLDLAYVVSEYQLANLLHEAAFRGILDLADLLERLEHARGYPWTTRVRRAIDLYRSGSAGTRSRSEDRFIEAWMALDFPEPRVNDPSVTGPLGMECDFVWIEHRIVLEIDGDTGHARPNNVHRDRGRDVQLAAAGWTVIRVSSSEVWNDIDAVITRVRHAMSQVTVR